MAAAARFASQQRMTLPGSEKEAFAPEKYPGMERMMAMLTPPSTARQMQVSVVVKPKTPIATRTLGKPASRMTRSAYAAKHGADPAAVTLVKAFAKEYGLAAAVPHPGRHALHLTGTVAQMERAFGVTLDRKKTAAGTFRVREGSITLPAELAGQVTAVLGLDNRPAAKPHFRARAGAVPHAGDVSYTPLQVAQLYGFPSGVSAAGQTIALIELGGGYKAADLTAYFKSLGVAAPSVSAVLVGTATNKPTKANSADGEVMLDIEVCAAVAPGAKIVVYFAPNTDQGFLDAISTAVHDKVHRPSVISISWGGPESSWTAQAMTALDAACQAAALLGVTITVASGDDGSTDGVSGTANHVDFPASSPHVLACGGTRLVGSGITITSEVVWNELTAKEGAGGGGVSAVFALPAWQKNAGVPLPVGATGGRGVPDVSGDADPATGYVIRVDGTTGVIGGTSAVAPLWAGLIALANAQNKASAGFVNPALYAAVAKKAFRDITVGNNGAFKAAVGWDACTGLGSPVGTAVVTAVAPKAAATKGGKKK